jgi:rubredoxin
MGKMKALKLGITKGIAHTASVVLPKIWHCPICKMEFKAFDIAVQSKELGVSPEQIIGEHITGCIARLKGAAQCPDCGKTVKGKDFKEHMEKTHPLDKIQDSIHESEKRSEKW